MNTRSNFSEPSWCASPISRKVAAGRLRFRKLVIISCNHGILGFFCRRKTIVGEYSSFGLTSAPQFLLRSARLSSRARRPSLDPRKLLSWAAMNALAANKESGTAHQSRDATLHRQPLRARSPEGKSRPLRRVRPMLPKSTFSSAILSYRRIVLTGGIRRQRLELAI